MIPNNIKEVEDPITQRGVCRLERILEKLSDHILRGKVAAVPTETVYGLVADASSTYAVDKVRRLKHKPKESPIPIFIPKGINLQQFSKAPLPILNILEEAFLPGPLLLVFDVSDEMVELPVCYNRRIGFRKSGSDLVNDLLERTGKLLTATSANITDRPPCTTSQEVREIFPNAELLIVGSKKTSFSYNKPSTVVSMENDKLIVLRKGVIPIKKIKEVLAEKGIKQEVMELEG